MTPADREDTLVVRRVIRGDREAFEKLVNRHQERLFRYLYHLLRGDRGRAEEATQESFLKAFSHLSSYDPGKKFSTWLFAIARNLAIDEMKKAKPVSFSTVCDPAEGSAWLENRVREERTPAIICVEREEQRAVMKAVESLPTDYREVVVLRYFEGLPYLEIAQVLGLPVTTIKIRLFRAKKRLFELLGDVRAVEAIAEE